MNPAELQAIVIASGYECRIERDEVVLHTCTFCGNDHWNLELNAEKGIYGCWVCKAGGRLTPLLQQLTGQTYQFPIGDRGEREAKAPVVKTPAPVAFAALAIADVPSALHYLRRRGIDTATATAYGLCVCTEKGHRLEGRIVIPAYDYWSHTLLGWVGRSYTGRHPKYLSTLPTNAITGWHVRGRGAPVVLVEGHIDGIAVHQAGYHAAVLSGTGGAALTDFAGRLSPDVWLVIMLDGEAWARATELYWHVRQIRETVLFAALPPGVDPGALAPGQIQEYVSQAGVR